MDLERPVAPAQDMCCHVDAQLLQPCLLFEYSQPIAPAVTLV
jgi:hypothetical protein